VFIMAPLTLIALFAATWFAQEGEKKEGLMDKIKKVVCIAVSNSVGTVAAGYVPGALPL